MRKIVLFIVALTSVLTLRSQSLLVEDFSNGIPSDWTMFNDENISYNTSYRNAWVLNTQRGNNAPCVASTSWFSSVSQADRWLITPALTIPTANYKLVFEAAALEDAYPDGFEIRISTNGDSLRSNFEDSAVLSVARCSSSWTEYMVDLSSYVGQTIHIAFIQNSLDMNLLMLDNIYVGIPAQNAIALRQLYIPSSAKIDTPVEIRGMIVNRGTANLTGFNVQYTVNGILQGDIHVGNINIPHGGSYTFTCSPNFIAAYMNKYHITVTAYYPNGVDDDPSDNSLATDIVVFDSALLVNRTNLVELMLLDSCGICPTAWQQAEMATTMANGNYIMMAYHGGSGSDALTNESSRILDSLYNSDNHFVPAIAYNRARLSTNFPGPLMGISSTVDQIGELMNRANALPNFVYMQWDNTEYDETSRTFTGSLSGHFTYQAPYANPKLDIYLVEDSVLMPQATSSGWNREYRHAQIVRGIVASYPFPNADSTHTFNYNINYQLPESNRAWRCRLVAVMANNDPADANNNEVSTAVVTDRFPASYIGIDQVGVGTTIDLYPNPASQITNIEANSPIHHLVVLNARGQQVFSTHYIEGNNYQLDVSHYPQGLYLLRVETATGVSLQKLTVVR
ncbi:MAG: choice-of-anchor J domain-containing protein [Bacteroidales bacterium]|nr:choice-of-anchor J domain-containing protein [Bacteroidales bacterium]